jgi:hypothetical protein
MIEIQRADPQKRRQVLAIVLAVALVGAALIVAFQQYRPELDAWLSGIWPESRRRFGIVLAVMAMLACAPLFGLAIYLWFLGGRVIRAQRFPLPGTPVVRDTPVLRERAAILRGRVMRAFAAAFAFAALGMLFALWRLSTVLPA